MGREQVEVDLQVGATPGGEQLGEGADVLGQGRQVRPGGQEILQVTALVLGQVPGLVMIHDTRRRGGGDARSAWARPWLR